MDNLNFISRIKVESNLEWLQATILTGGKNETTNTIHFSKKDVRDLGYLNKLQTIDKTLKQSCIDYPSEEDLLFCCN